MIKIFIFDFDGTVANTIPVTITILKKFALKDYNKLVDDKLIQELRDKPIPEIFKALKIPIIKLPFIANKARKELNKEIEKLKPIKGIDKILLNLKKQGKILGIVSSNSRESIIKFLEKNNLQIFDFIYSNSKVFGKSSSLKKVLSEYNYQKQEIAYIGDEIRDIEAARKVGIKIVAVTWGVNTQDKLQTYEPDYVINKPEELISLISE